MFLSHIFIFVSLAVPLQCMGSASVKGTKQGVLKPHYMEKIEIQNFESPKLRIASKSHGLESTKQVCLN